MDKYAFADKIGAIWMGFDVVGLNWRFCTGVGNELFQVDIPQERFPLSQEQAEEYAKLFRESGLALSSQE